MRLTSKLLSRLNRVFNKDPERFLAFRLRHSSPMSWDIEDGTLRTIVSEHPESNLQIDLRQHKLPSLEALLSAQPGYEFISTQDSLPDVSATVLMDGNGNIDTSNGDHFYAYSSTLWAYMESQASELQTAAIQAQEAVEQLSTKTADEEWLDEIGSYYGVARVAGESDALYGPRIIATVLMPRGNNIAIEMAIEQSSNGLRARIVDSVDTPVINRFRDGSILFNGSFPHASGEGIHSYNLFDALFDIDISSPIAFDAVRIAEIIDDFRDAGNHLRRIGLTGSMLDTSDSGSWQDFVAIESSLTASGNAATAASSAPTAIVTAGTDVSASIGSASVSAPAASAMALPAGEGHGQIPAINVAAPTAKIAAGARLSAAGPTAASTVAPSGAVSIVPTEMLNIAIDEFADTYVSAVARRHNGDLTRDGAAVYDSGDETFEITIIGE